jgi:hypothetical protein
MNKLFNVKSNLNGYYFVLGSGFSAYSVKQASKLTKEQIECVKNTGYSNFSVIEVQTSFAVSYIRNVDLNADGVTVKPNVKNPSKRRFATRDEAIQHGSRFAVRKAKGSDVEGSAGHIGYYVIETSDPVNATINWKTGLTNPLKA